MSKKSFPLSACTFRQGQEIRLQDPEMPEGEDEDKGPRRFSLTALSGKPILGHWWWGALVIDLEGVRFEQSMPVLRGHDDDRIVGFTEEFGVVDGALQGSGPFSQTTPHAEEVIALADEGFPWQASVRAVPESIEEVEAGVDVDVNGQTVTGPATIFRQSHIRETSFVPLGADDETAGAALKAGGEIECAIVKGETMSDADKSGGQEVEGQDTDEERVDDAEALEAEADDETATAEDESAEETQDEGEDEGGEGDDPSGEEEEEEEEGAEDEGGDDGGDVSASAEDVAVERALAADRVRCASITEKAVALGVGPEAAALIREGATYEDAELSLREKRLELLQDKAPESAGPGAAPVEDGATDEQKLKAEYAKGQTGFASEGEFLAFKRAESRGVVSVAAKR